MLQIKNIIDFYISFSYISEPGESEIAVLWFNNHEFSFLVNVEKNKERKPFHTPYTFYHRDVLFEYHRAVVPFC